ncbi:Pyruvate decarboxylase 1 [Tritrichomonas musculus]|uniref:Pyruvate decarboxylase 1 n=1 Tax=Tritrichomonas musculus TaxID=1915356 RepID=A0ABR2HMQ2_9EUKA
MQDKYNNTKVTVGQYLFNQLKKLGIKDIFGVPGDYAFPIDDTVVNDPELRWIGCCNELNATYAADGYARIHGYSALCTTYGVGELSTFCGLGGAFAENVPIVHIVGMPTSKLFNSNKVVHHMLGYPDYHVYEKMISPAVCATALLTPKNVISEIHRVLTAMVQTKKPVYFCVPFDYCNEQVEEVVEQIPEVVKAKSDEVALNDVLHEIKKKIHDSNQTVFLVGNLIDRFQLSSKLSSFVEKMKIPFVSMMSGKGSIDESLDEYVGTYNGKASDPAVIKFVESSDCYVLFGTEISDFNTSSFSCNIPEEKTIFISLHDVRIGKVKFENVEFEDVVNGIISLTKENIGSKKLPQHITNKKDDQKQESDSEAPLSMTYLHSKIVNFLQPNDIVLLETGTSMAMNLSRMPKGCTVLNQVLWGAIGYATPAAFGAALAAPNRRVVLVTGEGSLQMTAQELCQFARFNLKPVLIIINNDGYLIERVLCKIPEQSYNDIPQWRYTELMHAFGAPNDFLSVQAKTCGELDSIFEKVNKEKAGAFIEVFTPKLDTPQYFEKF